MAEQTTPLITYIQKRPVPLSMDIIRWLGEEIGIMPQEIVQWNAEESENALLLKIITIKGHHYEKSFFLKPLISPLQLYRGRIVLHIRKNGQGCVSRISQIYPTLKRERALNWATVAEHVTPAMLGDFNRLSAEGDYACPFELEQEAQFQNNLSSEEAFLLRAADWQRYARLQGFARVTFQVEADDGLIAIEPTTDPEEAYIDYYACLHSLDLVSLLVRVYAADTDQEPQERDCLLAHGRDEG